MLQRCQKLPGWKLPRRGYIYRGRLCVVDVPRLWRRLSSGLGQIAPTSPSAPSPAAWSSAPWGSLRCPGERTVGAVQYTFFHWGGMTRRQSYLSSLHLPETLRATLDHPKFTHVPSAPNASLTTKNTRAQSYAMSAGTGSIPPAQHLPTSNNTQTPGPAPIVALRPHLQALHL